MAVQLFQGNIFESGAGLIACFANGDGIPFGFGERVAEEYPQVFSRYRKRCLATAQNKGAVIFQGDERLTIAYVVVADGMKDRVTVEAIAKGLKNLHQLAKDYDYEAIAIMAQLDRGVTVDEVKQLVCAEFDDSDVMVILYGPIIKRDGV